MLSVFILPPCEAAPNMLYIRQLQYISKKITREGILYEISCLPATVSFAFVQLVCVGQFVWQIGLVLYRIHVKLCGQQQHLYVSKGRVVYAAHM